MTSKYWNDVWEKKITPTGVVMNSEKMKFILGEIYRRDYLDDLDKVEIGCGTGIHARNIISAKPKWGDNYIGIDLSETAIEAARKMNVNAVCGDFMTYPFNNKFSLFILLDTLEHFEYNSIGDRIKELAKPEGHIVFGNIPLYQSEHDQHFERKVDINILIDFMNRAGCPDLHYFVYGICGYPYMIFEGVSDNARKYRNSV